MQQLGMAPVALSTRAAAKTVKISHQKYSHVGSGGAALLVAVLLASLLAAASAQTQSFVTKPSDTSVKLGDTALLNCSVSARHGDVQWVHDGTALGYDRKVPGKPRYSVISNGNEDTEYHLHITNVTLDDEGTFSCQVAPIGDWDTKLESKAKLTVLVAPRSPPDIVYNDESKNSNDIVYFKSANAKSTKFACTVRKSKPAAQIKWFINGTAVVPSVGKSTETKTSDGILEDVTSVLELTPQTQQLLSSMNLTQVGIRCQVLHQAFGANVELPNMSTSLRMIVVYPPSVPVISGYDESVGILAGSEMRLACSTKYTFPPAMLSWHRDGKLASRAYDTIDSLKTAESFYRITRITPADNKAVLKCDAINQAIDEPISANITLNVLYGPERLNMNGVFEVEEGKQISVLCSSEPANPSPRVKFSFNGIDFEPTTLTSAPTAATVAVGAYVVNATFAYTVQKEHNNKEIRCLAENKLANVQQIISRQIRVLYAPDALQLTYQHENKTVNEGTRVRLSCLSNGGNPLPEIEWKINGQKIGASSSRTSLNMIESNLDLVLERSHHNQVVECSSTNKVNSLRRQVKLNVSYLPSAVSLRLVDPPELSTVNQTSVKAGTRVTFACTASSSNPQPQIAWFKDSYAMLLQPDQQENVTSLLVNDKEFDTVSYMSFVVTSSDFMKELRCDVKVQDIPRTMHGSVNMNVKFPPEIVKNPPSVMEVNENATFTLNLNSRANPAPTYKCSASNNKKYTLANSTMTFNASRSDNGDFVCTVSNSEGSTEAAFKLNVKYAPSASVNSSLYVTTKGSTVQLYCIVDGNPLQSSHITWKLKDKLLTNSDAEQHFSIKFIPPSLSVLTIVNARDTDDGNFTCHVSNLIGATAVASTELRVKRAPVILPDSALKAGEDSNTGRAASFTCKAYGYPDVTFKWRQPNNVEIANSTKYTILYQKHDGQIFSSTLIVNSVAQGDYGVYTCDSRNEVGSVVEKAVLSGKHPPEPPSEFRAFNITRNSVALTWKKNFDGGDAQKFIIRYRKDTLDPTYYYTETETDATGVVIEGLEMATRYIINIRSINKIGTSGFIKEPLIVQTDFGFNEVNQLPIYTGNDLPLTIILVVCGVGTMLLLFNVALIVYLIKKRKKKGEADSTTDTNETEANTVEMFSPPPPYPDELNYQFDLNLNNFEEEHKPFMPHNIRHPNRLSQAHMTSSKYLKELNDQLDYPIEYATPIHQSWPNDPSAANDALDDEIYINSLRQLDKNLSAALAGVSAASVLKQQQQQHASFNTAANRYSSLAAAASHQFGASPSFNQSLNQITHLGDNILLEARAFPYERLSQNMEASLYHAQHQQQSQSPPSLGLLHGHHLHSHVLPTTSSQSTSSHSYGNSAAASCKIYQDLDEFKGHLV